MRGAGDTGVEGAHHAPHGVLDFEQNSLAANVPLGRDA
jgi:hypothetical protein